MIFLLLGTNLGDRAHNLERARRLLAERLGCTLSDKEVDSEIELLPWRRLFARVYEAPADGRKSRMFCSKVQETEAIGFDGEDFLNQVVAFESGIEPENLLDICQEIEIEMGRARHEAEYDQSGRRLYRNRVIDIDILIYNGLRIKTDRLTIPHPQVVERPFVRPLLEDVCRKIIGTTHPGGCTCGFCS